MSTKTAIVTGGASGLGLSISKSLRQAGFDVVILDINPARFQDLKSEFSCYQADVTQYEQLEKVIDEVTVKHPKIDVLVNNAGLIYNELLINPFNKEAPRHSPASFKRIIDLNLNSVFNVTSIVSEKMVRTRSKGTIINISSISARGNAGQSAYSASKAGVNALTKVWAKELGPYGINVVSIAPGFIATESTHQALSEKIIEDYIKRTPLKKLGNPDNIAKAALYAIDNKFVTGTILEVDGGLSL